MPHELNITSTIFISKNNDRKMENNKLKLTTKSKLMNNKSHKKLKKNTIAADTLIQFHQTQQRGTAALVHKKSCTFFFLLSCFAPALSSFYAYNNLQLISNLRISLNFSISSELEYPSLYLHWNRPRKSQS